MDTLPALDSLPGIPAKFVVAQMGRGNLWCYPVDVNATMNSACLSCYYKVGLLGVPAGAIRYFRRVLVVVKYGVEPEKGTCNRRGYVGPCGRIDRLKDKRQYGLPTSSRLADINSGGDTNGQNR